MSNKAVRCRAWFVIIVIASYVILVAAPQIMAALGVGHAGVWFLDLNTLLASNDALARGLDPYQPNPLDYLRDRHAYSDWWLQLRHLGLGRADRLWLGTLVNVIFFVALLWRLRPATWREVLLVWTLTWSPPVMLGFNRANPDLLIFALLAPLATLLVGRGNVARVAVVTAVTLATGLKYFPFIACLLVFLTARTPRELGTWLLVWLVLGAVLALNLWDDVSRGDGVFVADPGFYTFGAAAFAANLGGSVSVFAASLVLGALSFAVGWRCVRLNSGTASPAAGADFFLGAALVVVCFVLTISYSYRLVFALLLVPWLLEAIRAGGGARRYAWAVLIGMLALFWADAVAVLVVRFLTGIISVGARAALIDASVLTIHAAGWGWVWLLLAGLGAVTRDTALRWGLRFGAEQPR